MALSLDVLRWNENGQTGERERERERETEESRLVRQSSDYLRNSNDLHIRILVVVV